MLEIRRKVLIAFLLLTAIVAACDNDNEQTPQPTQQVSPAETVPVTTATEGVVVEGGGQPVTQEPTPIPPSPTPSEPLAALVNGQPILLADYESELARFQQTAVGGEEATAVNYSQITIDFLVERALIQQAAANSGVSVTEEELNTQVADSRAQAGSAENFAAWLQINQLTEEEFRKNLAAELLTQKMIEMITADVPFAAEQVHARYIRVNDGALAQSLVEQINNGADFAELARQNSLDPSGQSGGEMGFFSAGTLTVPELEPPAFALQPGESSQVIPVTHSDGSPTFYILQVVERDPQRPLSSNQRDVLLRQTINAWIQELRNQAEITIFVDTNAQ